MLPPLLDDGTVVASPFGMRRLAMTQREDFARDVFRALNAGELDRLADMLTPDCDFVAPGFSARGRDGAVGWLRVFLSACPDVSHEVLAVAGEGDVVAVELRVTGTHTAPFQGPQGETPPTGRAFDIRAADIWRMDGDRIAAYHIYFDQMELFGQLGLLPEPAAAG
jgi:ketosteroid isomerase-like protein